MTNWPKWSPAPGWPSSHLLGGAEYRNATSHSDPAEFRKRMKRRQEDAQRKERHEQPTRPA